MKRLALFFAACLAPLFARADVLVLRNQSEVSGTISSDDGESVTIRTDGPEGSATYAYADLATINGLPAARIQALRREVTRATSAFAARGIAPANGLAIRVRAAGTPPEVTTGEPSLAALAAFGLSAGGNANAEGLASWLAARRYARADLRGTLYLLVTETAFTDPSAPFWNAAGSRPEAYAVTREYGLAALDAAIPAARDESRRLAGSWSDAALALEAARTGVAAAVSLDALLDPPGLAPDQGDEALDLVALGDAPPPADSPQFLVAWRNFPEREGARFARTARFAGGWRLAVHVLDDPPDSTEQVMHPEKYFVERDSPSVVTLADLPLPRGAEGFGVVARGTMGEAMTLESLRHAGGPGAPGIDEEPARRAAAGWDGDAWIVLGAKDGALALVWVSTWDSPEDAREFGEAAAAAGALRHGRGKTSADGTRIRIESAGARGVAEWKDRVCVVIEGMPTDEAAAAMAESAWRAITVKEDLSAPLVTASRESIAAAMATTDALAKGWTTDPPHPEPLGGRLDREERPGHILFHAAGAFSLEVPAGWEARSDPAALVLTPPGAGLSVSFSFHRLPADAPPALVFARARALARPQGDAPFLPYAARTADGHPWCQFAVPGLDRRTHIAWAVSGRNAVRMEATAPLAGAPDEVKKALQAALGSVTFDR
ncbi:MAG: hypothetical protein K8T20_17225 [Planctomycetes bacterium]|nr:hypothetical protein [Planctomycetota bacterium]